MVLRDSPVRRAISRIGIFVTQCPASDNSQKSHVDHSISPRPNPSGKRVHMGQFSVEIWEAAGSVLSDIQQQRGQSPRRTAVSATCA